MTTERPESTALPCHVVSSRDADTLRAIRDEHVNIAIWERDPISAIAGLKLDGLPNIRLTSTPGELPDMLDDALDQAGYSKCGGRHVLVTDILVIANRFAMAMQIEKEEIRLEVVTTNACKKFHADYVTARLITTYAGQGTQWLSNDDAADCDCGEPHNIQQLSTGDVALFKGRLWSPDAPAIHRSPPIAGTGEKRLMLVINPGN